MSLNLPFGAFLFLSLGSFNPLSVSNRGYAPGGNHTGWIQGRRKPHNSCFCLYFFLFATVLFCSSCLSLDPYLGCGWCTTTESCLARSSEKSLRSPTFLQFPGFSALVVGFRGETFVSTKSSSPSPCSSVYSSSSSSFCFFSFSFSTQMSSL